MLSLFLWPLGLGDLKGPSEEGAGPPDSHWVSGGR